MGRDSLRRIYCFVMIFSGLVSVYIYIFALVFCQSRTRARVERKRAKRKNMNVGILFSSSFPAWRGSPFIEQEGKMKGINIRMGATFFFFLIPLCEIAM